MSNNFRRTAVLKKYDLSVLRKLFDIRFSYKHCNFSHVCLLVKMASKTRQGLLRFAFSLNSVTASLQLRFNLSKLFSLKRMRLVC